MKLLSWLMNIQYRYYRQGKRYARGGALNRVLNMLILTVVVAGSLFLEYYSLKMLLVDGNIIGALLLVIAFACVIGSIELCSVYTYFGLKSASKGNLNKWLEKAENKRKAKKRKDNDSEEVTTSEEATTGEVSRKCPKWLDIVAGVYFLCLTIGEIAMVVVVFGMIN